MCYSDLKNEMKVVATGLKKSVKAEIRSEEFAENEAERLDNIFKQILKEKLESTIPQYAEARANLDLEKITFFYEIYEDYNEEQGDELEAKFWKLNGDWFKVQLEILELDCDDYEMDYTMGSELSKFFSEDPDNRRDRLEGPLQSRLSAIDTELENLAEERENNRYYDVKLNEDNFEQFFMDLEKIKNAE